MQSLHEARFYERLPANEALCTLCPHRCRVRDGGRGACGVRFNERGTLRTLVYERTVSRQVDPVEKKPLFHFFPGTRTYSMATVGCNLRCAFCQNWALAQWPKEMLPKNIFLANGSTERRPLDTLAGAIPGEKVTPQEIVELAIATGCRSIAYTYTEPTTFYELAYDTALLARERGLKNVLVTNGFISEAPLREFARVLDAANVDLKFFSEESYRKVSRARLEPVLNAIRLYRELGVWVEVTTLVIPGVNDSDEELGAIAKFLRSLGADVPWHVSRFYPAYRMLDRAPTPPDTLRRAAELGRAAGLRHVYEGNVPGGRGEDTRCSQCSAVLVERRGFTVRENRIERECCPDCGTRVDGVGMSLASTSTPTSAAPALERRVSRR
jgi:pyruvate formate lyase activating enzyme